MINYNIFIFFSIQHPKEKPSKSTAIHACVLSPNVEFYKFPQFPEFPTEGTFVLFPSEGALSIDQIQGPVKKLVVLDSTWQKSGSMIQDPRVRNLPRVKINSYDTTFWRYQDKPSDHLATIEGIFFFILIFEYFIFIFVFIIAIYYFYKEYHQSQHGSYNGEYDGMYFQFYVYFVF